MESVVAGTTHQFVLRHDSGEKRVVVFVRPGVLGQEDAGVLVKRVQTDHTVFGGLVAKLEVSLGDVEEVVECVGEETFRKEESGPELLLQIDHEELE